MINRILMELYDEYEKGSVQELKDFAEKTFDEERVRKLFIGCTLVMFSLANTQSYKPRYNCTRENLLDIVMSAKEKIGDTILLDFYAKRVNKTKKVITYFNDLFDEENLEEYVDVLISYLEQFRPRFRENLLNNKKIELYANN